MTSASTWVERTRRFFAHEIWGVDLRGGTWMSRAMRLLQLSVMISESFVRHQLTVRAAALTYVTTLALIPLLALALGMVQALGVTEDLAKLAVDQVLAAVPEQARHEILERVQSANLKGLGTLGSGVLFVTTVLALRNVEGALNDIWGIVRRRSWVRRFPDYLAVLVVIPLFTGIALSMSTTFMSNSAVQFLLRYEVFSALHDQGLQHAPLVFFSLGFSFLYWFFPNTNVRILSALLGGVIAALLFGIAQSAYAGLVVGGAKYSVMFGGMAAIPLTLMWIYISWAIVLFGAEVSYAHQNLGHYRREVRDASATPAEREALAISAALEIGRAFRDSAPPPTALDLSNLLDAGTVEMRDVLLDLEGAGIVRECVSDDRDSPFQLGRPAERVALLDLWTAVRGRATEDRSVATEDSLDGRAHAAKRVVSGALYEFESAVAGAVGGKTLADLLADVPAAQGTPSA